MKIRVFCFAVGVMAAGTRAQVPIFKLWLTEVYEVNPDGSYTAKCGPAVCPTQDLPAGIARPGDLINIEVMVEGWDASTDSGKCDPAGEACSVSAQDCALSHCSGAQSREPCSEDSDCLLPDTCDPDTCEKSPLVGAFQWTIDSSTYSNGGPGPGFAPAELACTTDADCACLFTEIPGSFNDCADYTFINPDFCTCDQPGTCDEGVCGPRAVAYFDLSPIPNFLFSGCQFLPVFSFATPDYVIGAICFGDDPGGVPEDRFRCNAGARPTCNIDADCPSGTCELVATSPYYLGTLLLQVTGESCGLFTLDLAQRLIDNVAVETFLVDGIGAHLPTPIVEPVTIDLGSAEPCDDGDPCTVNDALCGFECAGVPIGCPHPLPMCCPPDEHCAIDDLLDATWADADPLASDPFDRPGNCAIDARQPHWINDGNAKQGWDRLVLEFSCDPTDLAATLRPARFAVQTDPVEASPPAIPLDGIVSNATDRTITIHLDRSISPGFYTCILHIDSGKHWCAGFLPADANMNGLSAAHDILALIDAMNRPSVLGLPIYATDMNRGAVTTGADIIRLIDLLNGAGAFDSWIARSLPDCPSAP